MIDSVTWEEASSTLHNWVGQHSRWWKGFVQTYLVHMRQPVRLLRDLGPKRFMSFQLNFGFMTATSVLNPVFWVLTSLYVSAPAGHAAGITGGVWELYPMVIYIGAVASIKLNNWASPRGRRWSRFVQTHHVRMRRPLILLRALGSKWFLVLWALTTLYVSAAGHSAGTTSGIRELFPPVIFYVGVMAFVFGNAMMVYFLICGCAQRELRHRIVWLIVTTPAYYLLQFVAAMRGTRELGSKKTRSSWFHTGHGGGAAVKEDDYQQVAVPSPRLDPYPAA